MDDAAAIRECLFLPISGLAPITHHEHNDLAHRSTSEEATVLLEPAMPTLGP